MNRAKYSDVVNSTTKLCTVEQARERYKLSRGLLMQVAEDAGAIRRIGRSVRVDVPKMDKALENY